MAALWGRARRGLGAVRGRGSRLRGRWSFSPAGFRRAWPRGGRSDHGASPCVPCSWARDSAVPGGHAPSLGRRHARARVERSRVACAGVYAVPARAGWGRVNVGAALQGFGRAQRQRVSGAEDAGSVGVCLPNANNVTSRTHLRQEGRALSRSLERSLPLSLSLSRSLSPRSLARSLGVCVSRSQSHKTRASRDGGASADVSRRHGLRLQDAPPLECCVRSDELTLPMRMHCCLFSRAAMSRMP